MPCLESRLVQKRGVSSIRSQVFTSIATLQISTLLFHCNPRRTSGARYWYGMIRLLCECSLSRASPKSHRTGGPGRRKAMRSLVLYMTRCPSILSGADSFRTAATYSVKTDLSPMLRMRLSSFRSENVYSKSHQKTKKREGRASWLTGIYNISL